MAGIPTKQVHFDLNAVGTLAAFGVVFHHTLCMLSSSRYAATVSHVLYGMPSLIVLLSFSSMSMGMMRMSVGMGGRD